MSVVAIRIFVLYVVLYCTKSQQTAISSISCGETKTGYRNRGEYIAYEFESDGSYDDVYLDGCNSDYDMVLSIYNPRFTNSPIQTEDDSPICTQNQYAALIRIPDNLLPVTVYDTYHFVISGHRPYHTGNYNVKLVCTKYDDTDTDTDTDIESCGRYREAWHLLSVDKQNLYINGFKQLANEGKLASFTSAHATAALHQNAAFLPWHRYLSWELETAIRNLGGIYSCFGLPYWDWTSDIERYEYNFENYYILNSGLSGNGDRRSGNCVTGNFGPSEYQPWSGGNCLRRDVCTSNCYGPASASQLMSFITSQNFYGDDSDRSNDGGYRYELENSPHAWAHVNIGGDDGQLNDLAISPDDPVFYLLHSFVDYQYSLWQDCRDHDQVLPADITTEIYGGTLRRTTLDSRLRFGELETVSWSEIYRSTVTIRDMHSIDDWDYLYDKGDFFDRAQVDNNNFCNINPEWFKDSISRRRLVDYNRGNKSEYGEYSSDVFTKLHSRVGGKGKSKIQCKELYKTWARMDCEYLSMENPCSRPKYFDDCTDMETSADVGYGYKDINITLDSLIEKVSDYPCMVETRKKFYKWSKKSGNLLGLCKGDYDNFCDKDFKKEKGGDKCLAKLNKKRNKKMSDNAH